MLPPQARLVMGYWAAWTGGKAYQPSSEMGLSALMTLHFHMIMNSSVLFMLTDASPQGGYEYQIMEYYCIEGSLLIEVGEAAVKLKMFPKTPGCA